LDHLVCGGQQRFRDGDAERFGGLEVYEEFDFRGLLDREVGGLVALENSAGVGDANYPLIFANSVERSSSELLRPTV
jgi:hypothetical protein